ncbi:Clavaminate synthase-like protein [Periconia macrospinosa]|uniref:Clavaminate synthase-like protein n=1 Tax=Periconia macrospinosa TaxID=97972 RepID=A0A2V1E793_9PLEO|nr:Clavaminate synthase-like protein [Periconia macrospinosa]
MVLIQHHKPRRGPSSPTQAPAQATPAQTSPLPRTTTKENLTPNHGTLLSNIQLSSLSGPQLNTLANLVSTRGVVFLRDQYLTPEVQLRISKYLSRDTSVNEASNDIIPITEPDTTAHDSEDEDEEEEGWYTDDSPTQNASSTASFTIFKASSSKTQTQSNSRTAWVSQYGLYASLSAPMRALVDGLHVDVGRVKGKKEYEPFVVEHPNTGVKVLNTGVLAGGGGFRELKKKEGENILNFLTQHIDSSHAETLQWTWRANDVAIWDNRAVAYKHLVPSSFPGSSYSQTFGIVQGTKTVSAAPTHITPIAPLKPPPTTTPTNPNPPKPKKPHYNNTPSRRIIHHQLSFLHPTPSPSPPLPLPSTPHSAKTITPPHPHQRADSLSPISSPPSSPTSSTNPSSPNKQESPKNPAPPPPKKQSLSNSPLRRIVERQVSSSPSSLKAGNDVLQQQQQGVKRKLDVDFSKWGGSRRVGVYS